MARLYFEFANYNSFVHHFNRYTKRTAINKNHCYLVDLTGLISNELCFVTFGKKIFETPNLTDII